MPRSRRFLFLLAISLVLPFGLPLLHWLPLRQHPVFNDPRSLLLIWGYIWLPYGMALLAGLVLRRARQLFLVLSFAALCAALVLCQCWIWWSVPPRESSLAWIVYLPLCACVLLWTALVSAGLASRRKL